MALIEGMPAGVPVDKEFIDAELRRRQGGYGRGGRQKIEVDQMLMNCNNINPNFGLIPGIPATYPTASGLNSTPTTTPPAGYTGLQNCYADGEASAAWELTNVPWP